MKGIEQGETHKIFFPVTYVIANLVIFLDENKNINLIGPLCL